MSDPARLRTHRTLLGSGGGLALICIARHVVPLQLIVVGYMKKWTFRILGLTFIAAAVLQYISYNMPSPDGSDPTALASVFGWAWTVLIAFPGILLIAASSRR
ncbi:hypothetical protein ABID21_001871 [Pseudorhizobium tarimense]|uniref:Uncharacterized protein n=1 Tax=Pseudorhizobium tarimense TaxID=1079109 RepID=A0ABV2H5D2_9HYPH|nr:hypothetical protein [Pseudorhizobium tarimense]MCJ8518968.1 hypothetical protein [Pseudorhizobium tarimense]